MKNRTVFLYLLFSLFLTPLLLLAQDEGKGIIEGRIYNAQNNEPVPFANIVIWGTNVGAVSDMDGNFLFTGVTPGFVELRVSSVGFEPYISEQILVTNAKKVFVEIPLNTSTVELNEITVAASPFRRNDDSPVSLRRIGIKEIEKNPGGNRDISRVIQSLPGVASTPAFRNDVIVRGGGASENRFYLDGIEIPNINHFATQGASGGPVGIINVDFIREVNFYSGAFPANRGNALSSVLEFRQIDGNPEKLKVRASVGASDLALTLDGPLGDNTTFIASARRSYLQFLFSVLELPFLPTYNDFQFKTRTRFNQKNELIIVGLGAIDEFALNLDANETEFQRYVLNYLPVNEQWNYSIGAVYKHFRDNGFDTWVLSRNYLNNSAYKYQDNIEVDSLQIYDYTSAEIENKFRYEYNTQLNGGYKINYGAGASFAKYTNETFNRVFVANELSVLDYESYLDLYTYSFFGQISNDFFNDKLTLSLGLRTDGNTYSESMSNPLEQFSPRFSASYALTSQLFVNFNTGRYFQRPPYTAMGYRNSEGELVNRDNNLKYIQADHLVAGFDFNPDDKTKLSLEGFYKLYSKYPFSLRDSISIASKGGDFGIYGDEEVLSISEGRAYGAEFLARSRDLFGFNLILAYTWVRSEFKDHGPNLEVLDEYIPTAWDNRHILTLTATRSFKKNWDVGFKWRFVGGAPYTPVDFETSSLRAAWDTRGREYLDFSRFNSLRLGSFQQLDIRVDKQFFYDKWSLLFYVDVQNVYNYKSEEPARVSIENEEGNVVILNPTAPYTEQRYQLRTIESDGQGTVLPTIGIIVEF